MHLNQQRDFNTVFKSRLLKIRMWKMFSIPHLKNLVFSGMHIVHFLNAIFEDICQLVQGTPTSEALCHVSFIHPSRYTPYPASPLPVLALWPYGLYQHIHIPLVSILFQPIGISGRRSEWGREVKEWSECICFSWLSLWKVVLNRLPSKPLSVKVSAPPKGYNSSEIAYVKLHFIG